MLFLNTVGLFMLLVLVFAALLAFVFLGERLQGFHALGIAAIVSGIVLASWGRGLGRRA